MVTHSCDFEDPSICGYVVDNTTEGYSGLWERRKPDPLLYPTTDNTYQTSAGHFMYHKGSNALARLSTPTFNSAETGFCLEFFYY